MVGIEDGRSRMLKIALFRPILTPWEMKIYERIAQKHEVTAFTSKSYLTSAYLPFIEPAPYKLHRIEEIPHSRWSIPLDVTTRKIFKMGIDNFPPVLLFKLLSRDYDIVHVGEPYWFSSLISTTASMFRPRLRVVLGICENIFMHEGSLAIPRLVRSNADAITAVSSMTKDILVAQGAPSEKIRVISGGVDTELFNPDLVKSVRSDLGIGEGERVILYVGRLTTEKGLFVLLRAMRRVIDGLRGARLVLVGEGAHREQIKNLSLKLGLEDRVLFTGAVPYSKIHLYHAMADVFTLPSIPTPYWVEQFGNVLVEAMACGKPVVASRTGAIPEIVKHEETGLLVEPGDEDRLAEALLELLSNPELAFRLGGEGRRRAVSLYSVDRVAEKLNALYEEISGR